MSNLSNHCSIFTGANKNKGGNKQPKNKIPYILAIMASVAAAGIIAKSYSTKNEVRTEQASIKLGEFENSYHALKKQENWPEIIVKGTSAINAAVTNEEKSLIYLRLASSYFYLGNYEEAKKAALAGSKLAMNDPNLLGRSFYLQSAVYRAIKQQKPALEMVKKALDLTSNSQINNHIKAKIYFNAGALYQDLSNQSELASQYYKQAMELLKKTLMIISERQ